MRIHECTRMNTNEKRIDGKQDEKPDPTPNYYYITLYF